MNFSIERWLERLQVSARSQRVIHEALLDWRHEVARANSFIDAIRCHLLGAAAITRTAGFVMFEEISAIGQSTWPVRFALSLIALVIATDATMLWNLNASDVHTGRLAYRVVVNAAGSAPFAMAFAILTGRAAAKSPILGYFFVHLACAAVYYLAVPWLWHRYTQTFRPMPIMEFMPLPRYLLGFLFGLGLVLVVDRARTSHRRLYASIWTVAFFVAAFVSFGVISASLHRVWFEEEWLRTLKSYAPLMIWFVWMRVTWIWLARVERRHELART